MGGGVVGVVLVGGGVVGLLVGPDVGRLVGAVVVLVGGVCVVTGVVGSNWSTIWVVGLPGVAVDQEVVPGGTGAVVAPAPGTVAVGNAVGDVVGVAPGAGVLPRGMAGTFCVG